jgi:hypothetical protein
MSISVTLEMPLMPFALSCKHLLLHAKRLGLASDQRQDIDGPSKNAENCRLNFDNGQKRIKMR